jgi:CheY-like chemotaxis protein
VQSAEEALELLEAIQLLPEAFLIDYRLGGDMDGLDLVRSLRARYGQVCCGVISADRTRSLRQTCKSLEVPLLAKPLDRDRLHRFLADRMRTLRSQP